MKRFVVLLIIAAMLLPYTGATCEALSNPFSRLDEYREELIADAVGAPVQENSFALLGQSEEYGQERYIVRFSESASMRAIYECVKNESYELLADSSERLFLIRTANISAFTALCGEKIEYVERDSVRELETLNDPYYSSQWQFDSFDFDAVYEEGATGAGIVVAVLDSGINRNHTDLEGVNILAGFNAVSRTSPSGVDVIGHGTAVAGIIGASRGNGKGVAGICEGVSIMPVTITQTDGDIFSTDFIAALYFAADSGADIINMSFGGVDMLKAEQDAIDYAFAEGCILIGAAGNFEQDSGEREEYFYPASYNHVVSVASFNNKGDLSLFSRYNDKVDICAPGENIYVIYGTSNTAVISENGTSFAAPFVSAVAALALSVKDDDVSVTSDDFSALLSSTGARKGSDGRANVEPYSVVSAINSPIVGGITDGGVYYRNVTVTYNLGTATLDGAPFVSGTTVKVNGTHTLILTYGDEISEYDFVTDNLPLTFSAPSSDSLSSPFSITFSRGTATLNGTPYYSGKTISESGYYRFLLTGPYGNTVEKTFTLYTDLPTLYGVENGGVYSGTVELMIIGDGSATVGKKTIHSGETMLISEAGVYTVTLRNVGGTQTSSISFTLNTTPSSQSDLTVANAKLILDDANSNVIVYGSTLNGIRVYDGADVSSMIRYITTDNSPVLSYALAGNTLALMHSSSVSVMDTTRLRSGEPLRGTVIVSGTFISVASDGSDIYAIVVTSSGTELVRLNTTTFKTEKVCTLPEGSDALAYAGKSGTMYAYSRLGGTLSTVSTSSGTVTPSGSYNSGELFGIGTSLFIGNSIYNGSLVRVAVAETDGIIGAAGGCLFTATKLVSAQTGAVLGTFGSSVSDITLSGDNTAYVLYSSMKLVAYENPASSTPAEAFRTAPVTLGILGETASTSPYSSHTSILPSFTLTDWVHDSKTGLIYMIGEDSHRLYIVSEDMTTQETVVLNEQPVAIHLYDSTVYIAFENSARLFIYKNSVGSYLNLTRAISPAEMTGTNKMYCLDGGNIVTVDIRNGATVSMTTDKNGVAIGFDPVSMTVYLMYEFSGEYFIERYNAVTGKLTASKQGTESGSALVCDGTYLYGGSSFYDAVTLEKAGVLYGDVSAGVNECILTSEGIYNKTTRSTVPIPEFDALKTLFSDKYEVYAFTQGQSIIKLSNPGGVVPSETVDITFTGTQMADGVYEGAVTVGFAAGHGYLDGRSVDNGVSVGDGGTHTLIVVLPYGNTVMRTFTINPIMSGIRLTGAETVAVNGQTSLTVSFTPSGISELPVLFSATGDCAYVDKSGIVYGLKPGVAVITVSTEDGRFAASHTVTVEAYKLRFTNSRFKLTDDGLCAINIPVGTTVKGLIAYVDSGNGSAEVTHADGKKASSSETLRTGDKLTVINTAGDVASAVIALRGDANGDGYISPADLVAVNLHTSGKTVLAGAFFHAADTTLDGKVNLSDFLLIRTHLVGKSPLTDISRNTPKSATASVSLSFDSAAAAGDEIVLSISANDPGARALKGTLAFDSKLLDIVSVSRSAQKWTVEYNTVGERIDFVAYDEPLKYALTRESVIFTVTFRVSKSAKAGDSIMFRLVNAVSESGSADGCEMSFTVDSGESESRLSSLSVLNATEPIIFTPNVFVYRLSVPSDSETAQVVAECANEFALITVSETALLPDSETIITVTVDAGGGDTTLYRLYVTRLGNESAPSGEARLRDVSVSGGTIEGDFDPDVYEYDVISSGEEITFTAMTLDDGTTYEVTKGETSYTIVCTAQDGTVVSYVFNIISETSSGEASTDESGESTVSSHESVTGGGNAFAYMVGGAIVAGLAAIGVALVVIIRKRKKQNAQEDS